MLKTIPYLFKKLICKYKYKNHLIDTTTAFLDVNNDAIIYTCIRCKEKIDVPVSDLPAYEQAEWHKAKKDFFKQVENIAQENTGEENGPDNGL